MPLMDVCRKVLRLGRFRKTLGGLLGAAVVIGASIAARYYWGPESASADPPPVRPTSASVPAGREIKRTGLSKFPNIVAVVNGQQYSRDELSRACMRHYGKKVLEAYINKHLIALECRRRGIKVTAKEVDDEINRNAKQFGFSREQFLELIERERGIGAAEPLSPAAEPVAKRTGCQPRRCDTPVQAVAAFDEPANEAELRHGVEQAREPGRPCELLRHVRYESLAPTGASCKDSLKLVLRLEPGHVHAGGTFRLTRLASDTQVHDFFEVRVAEAVEQATIGHRDA